MKPTFSEARKRFPACCIGAWDEEETINSLIFAVDHELSLYSEDQDGCITENEADKCVKFLSWLRGRGIDTTAVLNGGLC